MSKTLLDLSITQGGIGLGMAIAYMIYPGPSIWIGLGFFASALMTYGSALSARRKEGGR